MATPPNADSGQVDLRIVAVVRETGQENLSYSIVECKTQDVALSENVKHHHALSYARAQRHEKKGRSTADLLQSDKRQSETERKIMHGLISGEPWRMRNFSKRGKCSQTLLNANPSNTSTLDFPEPAESLDGAWACASA